MTTIFATWDKHKQRWKFRDIVTSRMNQSAVARRKRQYGRVATARFYVPDTCVRRVKLSKVAERFYEWQLRGKLYAGLSNN